MKLSFAGNESESKVMGARQPGTAPAKVGRSWLFALSLSQLLIVLHQCDYVHVAIDDRQ